MIYIKGFFVAAMSATGFALLFNVPKRSIPKAALAGGLGWMPFIYFTEIFNSILGATFMAALVVGVMSEIFARWFKEAVTVFIIPAIIPLVPGAGMYYSMIAILQSDYSRFATVATETLFIACSISAGILIVSSITRILMGIRFNKKKNEFEDTI